MTHHQRHPPASEGIGFDDVPLINRGLFDHAVRAATDLHRPGGDRHAFIEALWTELASTFEWSSRPWPQELPLPPSPSPFAEPDSGEASAAG